MSTTLVDKPVAPKVPNLPAWCKRTTVGLEIVEQVTLQQWLDAFSTLEKTGKGHQWWIGDSLNEGEARFGEDYAQVIDPIEEQGRENEGNDETYRKYQQVACRIAVGRRRPKLRFGHHQAVAFIESEEEQEFWLDLAESTTPPMPVAVLRRKIKKARQGGAENEPALDIQVLQDPAIRQWLDDYRDLIMAHDDVLSDLIKTNDLPGAKFLHRMTLAHQEQVTRQQDRTLAIDCGIVKKAVAFVLSATFDVIEKAMRARGFFMSSADLEDRLQLLIDLGEIKKEKAEEQRVAGARGDVVWEYKTIRQSGQSEKDKDDDDWV